MPIAMHAEEDCPSQERFVQQFIELEGGRISSWKGTKRSVKATLFVSDAYPKLQELGSASLKVQSTSEARQVSRPPSVDWASEDTKWVSERRVPASMYVISVALKAVSGLRSNQGGSPQLEDSQALQAKRPRKELSRRMEKTATVGRFLASHHGRTSFDQDSPLVTYPPRGDTPLASSATSDLPSGRHANDATMSSMTPHQPVSLNRPAGFQTITAPSLAPRPICGRCWRRRCDGPTEVKNARCCALRTIPSAP